MYDIEMVDFELVKIIERMTEQTKERGYPCGSTAENIMIAMVAKRPDWLPGEFSDPLAAIKRVYSGGPQWYHTMLYMHKWG